MGAGSRAGCQSRAERRRVFVLWSSVVVTFNREKKLLNGKDHGIKSLLSAEANLFWRAGTGSEFTACYVSHTQREDMALCPYCFSCLNVDI